MSSTLERILIGFSLALNLGFIIMALFLFMYHPPTRHERHAAMAQQALASLDLPAGQQAELSAAIDLFQKQMGVKMAEFRAAKVASMELLATPGPLDIRRLDELESLEARISREKHELIKRHVLAIRHMLGDEKGAMFFRQLTKPVRAEMKTR